MHHHGPYMKLHPVGYGLALGIISALFVFITGLFAMQGFAAEYVKNLSGIYVGYGPTLLGAFLGAVWAFVGSFIMGVIVASLYNLFVCCGRGRRCGTCCHSGMCRDDRLDREQEHQIDRENRLDK